MVLWIREYVPLLHVYPKLNIPLIPCQHEIASFTSSPKVLLTLVSPIQLDLDEHIRASRAKETSGILIHHRPADN